MVKQWKRVDVRMITDKKDLVKWVSKPTFVSFKIFNEDLVAIHKIKETLLLNRPCYVGMCILELSKTLMFDFHYNYFQKKYNNARLLFTDTDSLMYHIKTEDVYEEMMYDKAKFDNSDYKVSSKYHFNDNKTMIGKFKDAGNIINSFVGLKSKMYSYLMDNGDEKQKAKGVKKYVIKK